MLRVHIGGVDAAAVTARTRNTENTLCGAAAMRLVTAALRLVTAAMRLVTAARDFVTARRRIPAAASRSTHVLDVLYFCRHR